ncbi:chromosome transmission fidelity protein 18 homolog isoform X2 [Oratosquilla oratoria]|uniref:chromosome transmission fidelity protein 18 homolog isoform X2 n=1 Tax=Oratosquilla oratoria TaxID=337810 RepID=UPI003F7602E1
MDEFPDPEEEYENMYADEMEMMRDFEDFHPEDDVELLPVSSNIKSKKNLFTNTTEQNPINFKSDFNREDDLELVPDLSSLGPKRSLFTNPLEDYPSNSSGGPGVTSYDAEKTDSQKRSVEEAFDDLDKDADLDVDLLGNKRKKRKPLIPLIDHFSDPTLDLEKHENDLTLIDRIVAERKKKNINEFLENVSSNQNTVMNDNRERHTMKKWIYRHIPEQAFQTLSTEGGERLYVTVMDEDLWENQTKGITKGKKAVNLLNTSYRTLRAQADKIREKLQARIVSASNQNAEDSGMDSGIEDSDSPTEALWVERFKPKHYLDLLSDESTNRTVLQWIKMWDKIVFGIVKKVKKKDEKKDNKDKDGKFNKFGKFNNNKKFNKGPELIVDLDEQGRPVQKTILLSGPPGLGKTTLAHVIARHAGYNVVEMNASDDRSVDMFRTRIENAISMQSVLGPDPRPNCLIIDEIDGAPAPSINYLVSVLSGQGTASKGKRGKKKEDHSMLQRPVICICNDLYTPALRPLRQLALVIQFPPTLTSKLAQRLFEISRKQRLRADLTVLMSLCEKAENDIRSCLSVLQFVRSTHHELKLKDIDGAAIGQKDYQRSLFNVWRDIFSIPRPKRKRRCNPHEEQLDKSSTTLSDNADADVDEIVLTSPSLWRFNRILQTVQSCGEYDKLTQGWFENFPNMKFKHTSLDPISAGLDWASFTDLVYKEIHHSQSWLLMAYLPYACVTYHHLFATHQRPKIHYPNQQYEANNKLGKVQNLMAAVVNEMVPATRSSVSPSSLIKDIFPYLLQIIQPNLRPVNTQLYSTKEREELNQLINTMISYNLTYHQEKSQEGQYAFTLDPNVEEIVQFPGVKQTGRQMPYTARQLIAREIELEKVRRAENYFAVQEQKQPQKESTTQSECSTSGINKQPSTVGASSSASTKDKNDETVPNHLHKLEAKPVKEVVVPRAPCDFFGRIVQQINPQEQRNAVNEIVKSDIWFCFKEGYSNAVRRPIRIKNLL